MTKERPTMTTPLKEKIKKGKFLKKKKVKGWVIAVIGIAAVFLVVSAFRMTRRGQQASILDLSDTTVLEQVDLQSTISTTGTIESAQKAMIYSTNAYTVKSVQVQVGDYVEEGQLLAELDDQSIREQITSQELSLAATQRSSSEQIKSAQANYDNYKYGLDNGLNSSVNSAQSQVDSALETYEKAKLTYDRYLEGLNLGENTTIINAESALRSAESSLESANDALDTAQDTYNDALAAYNSAKADYDAARDSLYSLENREAELIGRLEDLRNDGADTAEVEAELLSVQQEITAQEALISQLKSALDADGNTLDAADAQLDSAYRKAEDAEKSYESQLSSYNASLTSVDNTLADYATSVESAWSSYQKALVSLESAKKSAQDQLQTYENSLSSAKNNANTDSAQESLRQLRVDLDGTKIAAPCAGTITAVYAQVGSSGSGLLFVIEDTGDLIVDTSVKEYDLGVLKVGMPVLIRSDATGDTKIDGTIRKIAPTANKTSQGLTDTSGDPLFAVEVSVTGKDTDLRIGMEAQLDCVVEEAKQVYAVPYDAVYENEKGENCILAAIEQENGTYLIREIVVTTGMDDDLDIAIFGSGLTDGLRIIDTPDTYRLLIGQTVAVGTRTSATSGGISGMMGGGAS